jgi:uncharacterized protein YdeI (YjbR/CyaY-like superfamily)
MRRDPRVTAFIDGRAPFARPILRHLRKVIHVGGGAELEEDIKWGMPAFVHHGKIVCGLGAFKAHCALWFRDGKTVVGDKPAAAMGQFGRITSVDDLPPPATIAAYVAKAMQRIDAASSRVPLKQAATTRRRRTPARD